MLFNRRCIIMAIWIGFATGLASCVATTNQHDRDMPKSIAGTTDQQGASETIIPKSPPLKGGPPTDLQHQDDTTTQVRTVVRAYPFAPASMRIHPLTRVTSNPDNPDQIQIDLRIELNDRFGDTTKGIGTIRIKLFPRLSENEKGTSEIRLALWTPEFMDVDKNSQLFDRVTRTYHFLLDVPTDISVPTQITLVATLTTDTNILTARRDLQLPKHQLIDN